MAVSTDGALIQGERLSSRVWRFRWSGKEPARGELRINYDVRGEELTLARTPLWIAGPSDAAQILELLPSDEEIFDRRLRFAAEYDDPNEWLFAVYDEQTSTIEALPRRWNDLSASRIPLTEPARLQRLKAITDVGALLHERVVKRGESTACGGWSAVEPHHEAIRLLAQLHWDLFSRFPHLRSRRGLDPTAIATAYAKFANGFLRRTVEVRGAKYRNGEPNSTMLLHLVELAFLLVDGGVKSGLWGPLLPAFVAMAVIYANAYAPRGKKFLGAYGRTTYRQMREPVAADRLLHIGARFQAMDIDELAMHWGRIIKLMAPEDFDLPGPLPGYNSIDEYIRMH